MVRRATVGASGRSQLRTVKACSASALGSVYGAKKSGRRVVDHGWRGVPTGPGQGLRRVGCELRSLLCSGSCSLLAGEEGADSLGVDSHHLGHVRHYVCVMVASWGGSPRVRPLIALVRACSSSLEVVGLFLAHGNTAEGVEDMSAATGLLAKEKRRLLGRKSRNFE